MTLAAASINPQREKRMLTMNGREDACGGEKQKQYDWTRVNEGCAYTNGRDKEIEERRRQANMQDTIQFASWHQSKCRVSNERHAAVANRCSPPRDGFSCQELPSSPFWSTVPWTSVANGIVITDER